MSKKPAPKKPTPGRGDDPFPWWLLLIAAAVLAAMTIARRWTIPTFLTLAVIGWALTINWLPIRKRLGVVSLLATWATLGASWPWGLRPELWHAISWAVYLALGAWAAWNVGRVDLSPGHAKKRKESLIRMAWPDFRDNIGAKGVDLVDYDEHTDDNGTVVRIVMVLKNPPGNPFNPAGIAKDIDNVGRGGRSFPAGSTRFDKGELEGDWIFTTDLRKPWTVTPEMPTEPNANGDIPIGYDQWGDIVWLPLDIHGLVAGETDSGKSTFLELLSHWCALLGRRLLFVDPKRVEFGAWKDHPQTDDYANTFPEARRLLVALVAEMDRRQEVMERHHIKKWKPKHEELIGPRLTCFIDETSDLFDATERYTDDKGKVQRWKVGEDCAESCVRLARVARAMGITVVFAAQYPTTDSVPAAIKQNTPITVCLRVKNGTAVRVALGEDAGSEWDTSKPLPQGRAVVDMPRAGKRWVQLFMLPERPELETVADLPAPVPPRPDTPAWPAPSVRLSDPLPPPTDQVEHPQTNEQTDKPDNQPDPILDALDPHEPRSITQVVEATGLTRYQVHTTLTKHEKNGRVRRPHGPNKGYVRAST